MGYYKKIISSAAQEKEYRNFMLGYETYSLRIVCLIGIIYTCIFLIIDYWRAVDFVSVLFHRSIIIIILMLVVYITWRIKLSPRSFYLFCFFIFLITVLLSISMDSSAALPQFFLPNFICLLFYISNAGLGYPLRFKFILSGAIIALYVFYSVYFSPHYNTHLSQLWNLLVNLVFSLLIGYLIERYKRINFIQTKEIETLSTVKSKLISILSHDLNSPLNSLNGLLYLNEKSLLTQQELNQNFGKVRRSVDSVSFLLQNLLRWSKTQLQGFKPKTEKLEVKKIIEDVLYSLESISEDKGIRFLNKVDEKIIVYSDSEMVKLVVRNILSNSIKFSHLDSTIEIAARNDSVHCTLSIKDSGVGMTQEEADNLFSFERESKRGTQNESGTGIGLMLTKEFIETLGGTISVVSESGKGSIFYFTLPTQGPSSNI